MNNKIKTIISLVIILMSSINVLGLDDVYSISKNKLIKNSGEYIINFNENIINKPMIDNNTVYIYSNNHLYLLDSLSGNQKYKFNINNISEISMSDNKLFVVSNNKLYTINKSNGNIDAIYNNNRKIDYINSIENILYKNLYELYNNFFGNVNITGNIYSKATSNEINNSNEYLHEMFIYSQNGTSTMRISNSINRLWASDEPFSSNLPLNNTNLYVSKESIGIKYNNYNLNDNNNDVAYVEIIKNGSNRPSISMYVDTISGIHSLDLKSDGLYINNNKGISGYFIYYNGEVARYLLFEEGILIEEGND